MEEPVDERWQTLRMAHAFIKVALPVERLSDHQSDALDVTRLRMFVLNGLRWHAYLPW